MQVPVLFALVLTNAFGQWIGALSDAMAGLVEALSVDGAIGMTLPLFALAIGLSPGPSNMVLLSAGAGFGVRRSVPLLIGMALGYGVMWGGAAPGLRFAAALDPIAMRVAQAVALVLMGVMAVKLVTAPGTANARKDVVRPRGLVAGFAFQFVNPKAWATAAAAAALFCSEAAGVLLHAVVFGAVATGGVFLGCGLWLCAGARLGQSLRRPWLRRAMNTVLAAMLIGTAVPLVLT